MKIHLYVHEDGEGLTLTDRNADINLEVLYLNSSQYQVIEILHIGLWHL